MQTSEEIPLIKAIQGNDVIFSTGYPSTALFESLWLGKKVFLTAASEISNKILYGLHLKNSIPIIPIKTFLDNSADILNILNKQGNKNTKEYFISSQSRNSAEIITDSIVDDIKLNNNKKMFT